MDSGYGPSSCKASQLLMPVTVDLLKFVHSKSELLWGHLPSLIAGAILSIAQKIVKASCLPSDFSPVQSRWLTFPFWDSPQVQDATGVKYEDFDELALLIELTYKQFGGGSTSYLLFP